MAPTLVTLGSFSEPDGLHFCLGILSHGAKLKESKMLFVLADALLPVKDRPRALKFDGERRHQRQWHGQKQTQKRDDHVDNSLRRENNAVSSKALRQRNPLGGRLVIAILLTSRS